MKKYKGILFDLDGTLLPMDMDEFMGGYFRELTDKIDHGLEDKEFQGYIWKATMDVIKNLDKNRYNAEVFFESFGKLLNQDLDEYKHKFDKFYLENFPILKKHTKPDPIVKDIIEFLKEKDVKLVVATNPVFPKEAIYERIKWAGLNKDDFQLITSYENMHFTKPNLEYYREILEYIDIDPEDAMMVGNDMGEDMVSCRLGISTFFVDTFGIKKDIEGVNPNYSGSLEGFYSFIKKIYK